MKKAICIAALSLLAMLSSPAVGAPTIHDTISCVSAGLACSTSSATIGSGVEFTGGFGASLAMLSFNFSDGNLTISNAYNGQYGYAGKLRFSFQDLDNSLTQATLVSNNGFTSLSQTNFTVSDGVLTFSAPFFSAAPAANLTLRLDSVAAVPEPMSWALMILGLGVVGTALRRLRAKNSGPIKALAD